MTERIAVYPGSFDPLTNGHLDILARARRLADRVIVAILEQDQKTPLFSVEDRIGMIRGIVGGDASISVAAFSGLLLAAFFSLFFPLKPIFVSATTY